MKSSSKYDEARAMREARYAAVPDQTPVPQPLPENGAPKEVPPVRKPAARTVKAPEAPKRRVEPTARRGDVGGLIAKREQKTAVYRHYDAAGNLLYVGASYQPKAREREHRNRKDWWADVARTEAVYYATRDEALAAESKAVAAEYPHHNKQLTQQTIAPPGACPRCDARRASIAAAVARHRARKLTVLSPSPETPR